MRISISDLAYAGFRFNDFCQLDRAYGLEFFYEFGTRPLLGYGAPRMTCGRRNGISMHGPLRPGEPGGGGSGPDLSEGLPGCLHLRQKSRQNSWWSTPTKACLKEICWSCSSGCAASSRSCCPSVKKWACPWSSKTGLRPKGTLLFDREAFLELPQRFPLPTSCWIRGMPT